MRIIVIYFEISDLSVDLCIDKKNIGRIVKSNARQSSIKILNFFSRNFYTWLSTAWIYYQCLFLEHVNNVIAFYTLFLFINVYFSLPFCYLVRVIELECWKIKMKKRQKLKLGLKIYKDNCKIIIYKYLYIFLYNKIII